MSQTAIYFMPGLAASSSIFEYIDLNKDTFKVYLLEWLIPLEKETLQEYALRISQQITQPNPVLIGVSFGGILVQEISKIIPTQKVIIISSVKSYHEFPQRIKFLRKVKLYKLIPAKILQNIDDYIPNKGVKVLIERKELYRKYLSVRNKRYLRWAIDQLINWQQDKPLKNIIHIHGNKDLVFPIQNINNFILLEGGTHAMIISKHRWFNTHLPNIINQ